MPSLNHLIFLITTWSYLTSATQQSKQDKCGSGYGKVNAEDCIRALQNQVPGAVDDTLRQYVPRLNWNDRTPTTSTLPVENTPKSWNYGTCSLGLVNLYTHLGPARGFEESSWWDIHTAFEDVINECVVGRGTGGADTVGTNDKLIIYIHSADSKVRSMLTSDAVRLYGICPSDFTSVNSRDTCPSDRNDDGNNNNNGDQAKITRPTYCDVGNGQADRRGGNDGQNSRNGNGNNAACGGGVGSGVGDGGSGKQCAKIILSHAQVLMGTLLRVGIEQVVGICAGEGVS